ncbi:IQ domain-containing protein IQM3-like [Coffea arabica]|uniref:IQ domain-containing protein IQM3-like n=1 Tax=Coffea arabica TaxID=13443 RepID=A0A6P6SXW5_COFAR|nr:IQ domain-containing protein IQM3-like [Coffea arabica]XP_027070853.1 IQ domain-containing protein IQM3-like [Coffea arabica]
MEVEAHALSSFDLNSSPDNFPFTTTAAREPPELRNSQPFRSSELLGYSESDHAPVREDLGSPVAAGGKCQDVGGSDLMAPVFSTLDSASPVANALAGEEPLPEKMGRCPSRAAMKLQKVYRSYRTRRMLADCAVVAEELWWQALDFARLNHSTVSFFNFSKPESAASRWNRVSLNASKVGKGLSKDAKAQKLAFQHWIEAIDPRHRYGHSLHLYYEEWCKGDAGQPFFFWLDLGDGKEVDLTACPRSKLRKQHIKYLGPKEREHYEYLVIEGKILHEQSGKPLDTTEGSPGAKWIFVMSTSKRLYAGEKKKGTFHHSSFLAGGVTLAAGRLVVIDGTLQSISPYSGHYRPTDDSFDTFLEFLKAHGVNLDEVEMSKANEDYENFGEAKTTKDESTSEVATVSDSCETNAPDEGAVETIEAPKLEINVNYRRTLSGGLQSPKAEVPKTSILQRINSKKAARSYQLGKQLSLKWSTGAGPRIGCIADYPIELRIQALEFTNLSPRLSSTSATPIWGTLPSPIRLPSQELTNGDLKLSGI